ncbi:hypothetical protein EJ04DRAFT_575416 [Polyplosphaeria fusca]|uniref:Uncharacterized protein n=1 Tax=Polyplosphaeria fusca TaxID=682080 RepID=A0A9P4R3R1_9PLEO|nr:hypothetical protein EJ04DRAFT_575416 [Polyplosphaeria fusca]
MEDFWQGREARIKALAIEKWAEEMGRPVPPPRPEIQRLNAELATCSPELQAHYKMMREDLKVEIINNNRNKDAKLHNARAYVETASELGKLKEVLFTAWRDKYMAEGLTKLQQEQTKLKMKEMAKLEDQIRKLEHQIRQMEHQKRQEVVAERARALIAQRNAGNVRVEQMEGMEDVKPFIKKEE